MQKDRELRMYVWGMASELYRLEGLQEFANAAPKSDPVDIKSTAKILAEAQLKLRRLHNQLASGRNQQKDRE